MESKNTNENYKKVIPKNTDDLYSEMKKNAFEGQLLKDGEMIVWKLDNNIIIYIFVNNQLHEGYIDTYYLNNGKRIPLTHWHPMEDEIYDDLMDINLKNIIWVKKKTIFGETLPIIMERTEYKNMSNKKKSKYIIV